MLTELAALLDLLKAKGVTHARIEPMSLPATFGVIDVTFGAPFVVVPSAAPPEEKEIEATQDDSDACRCGHSLAEHTNGLCLHACAVEQCAPEEK